MADPFPVSVPDVPGVPAVIFSDPVVDIGTLLTSSIDTVGAGDEVWGIYSGGTNVITADTVVGFEFRNESAIADYPVENGQLETYDKVAQPYEVRIRFVAGENAANRATLLDSVAAIAGDLKVYDAVTPEAVYTDVNVTRYSYQRTNESGVGLLVVDVFLQQIRVATSSTMSNTAQPSGADPVNLGNVQPQPAPAGLTFDPASDFTGAGGRAI